MVMSVRQQECRLKHTTDNHEYRITNKYGETTFWDDEWLDEYYKVSKHWKQRNVTHVEYRMYRTWKHTRKHQWKWVCSDNG